MLHVGFDAHFLATPYSGNGRYTAGLLNALKEVESHKETKLHVYGPRDTTSGIKIDREMKPGRINRILYQPASFVQLDRLDVFHSQYSTPLYIGVKRCLTIHDAAFARPDTPDYSKIKTLWFSYCASKADAIITVSESSRSDLERRLIGKHPEIFVVPNGVSLEEPNAVDGAGADAILAEYDGPYILYVGRMARRKRVPLLIKGFDLFRKRHLGTLVLIGPDDDDTETINNLIQGRRDIIRLKNVSESMKVAMLRRCNAFVYLSEYEGFGLPVIEAMQSGISTVVSDTAALIEVSKGNCIVVGSSTSEVAEAIEEAALKADRDKIESAKRMAAQYSWSRAAALTLEVYEWISRR